MFIRFVKVVLILASFIFTSGFVPFISLVGPGLTIVSSGNVYKAGTQYLIDQHIKNTTGRNSLVFFKDEVKKQHEKNNFDEDLRNLVEMRVEIVHKKLAQQNKKKDFNKDFIKLIEKRVEIARAKIGKININQ